MSPNQWSLESKQAVGYSFVQTMRGSFQRLGRSEGCSFRSTLALESRFVLFSPPPPARSRATQVIGTQCFMKTGSVCIRAGYLPPCALILDLLLINTEAGNEWGFLLLYSTVVSDICRTAEPLHSSSFQVVEKKSLLVLLNLWFSYLCLICRNLL